MTVSITAKASGTQGALQINGVDAVVFDATGITSGGMKPTLGTVVNSTSGTSIDFTGIPSWAKRITVMFNGVSTSGLSDIIIQLGATTFTTTGYNSGSLRISAGATFTTGFGVTGGASAAAWLYGGVITLTNVTGNAWAQQGVIGTTSQTAFCSAGNITLGGVLDRVRVTTVNGTDTFDSGSINIMYE